MLADHSALWGAHAMQPLVYVFVTTFILLFSILMHVDRLGI